MQFDIRPEAMKITWEDIDNPLKSLNNFVIENKVIEKSLKKVIDVINNF